MSIRSDYFPEIDAMFWRFKEQRGPEWYLEIDEQTLLNACKHRDLNEYSTRTALDRYKHLKEEREFFGLLSIKARQKMEEAEKKRRRDRGGLIVLAVFVLSGVLLSILIMILER